MRKELLQALLWGTVAVAPASAQGPVLDRLQIRHNLETRKEIPQPAFFQIMSSHDGRTTFAIGAGFKVDLISTPPVEIGPFVEYLRNTQVDKEQNTIRAGITGEWQVEELGKEHSSSTPIFLGQVNYKHDAVVQVSGAQASVLYTHSFYKEDALLPNSTLSAGGVFDLIYSPYLGLEYEHAGAGELGTNSVVRGVFRMEMALYPAAQAVGRRIQIGLTYIARHDLGETLDDNADDHPLLTAELNLFFLKDEQRQAGIGLSYTNGEDPSKGLADHEYTRLGLKVQI